MKMLHLLLLARQEKSSSMAHYHSGTELRKYSFADPPLLAELYSASGLTGFRAVGDTCLQGRHCRKQCLEAASPTPTFTPQHSPTEGHTGGCRAVRITLTSGYPWLHLILSDSTLMMSLLKPQLNIILRCLDKSHWAHRKLSRWLSNQEHKQL